MAKNGGLLVMESVRSIEIRFQCNDSPTEDSPESSFRHRKLSPAITRVG